MRLGLLDIYGAAARRSAAVIAGEFSEWSFLLHPGEREQEGPLGEFTGYYGGVRAPQPVIEVNALHMRRNPDPHRHADGALPGLRNRRLLCRDAFGPHLGQPRIDGYSGVICGVYAHPAAASGWGMTVVSLRQQYAGHVAQVLALAAQCSAAAYYSKWIIAVDDDVDPTRLNDVLWALSTRCNPADSIDILRNTWSTGLDPSQGPSELRPYGSKALIDACKPYRYLKEFPPQHAAAPERVRTRA